MVSNGYRIEYRFLVFLDVEDEEVFFHTTGQSSGSHLCIQLYLVIQTLTLDTGTWMTVIRNPCHAIVSSAACAFISLQGDRTLHMC